MNKNTIRVLPSFNYPHLRIIISSFIRYIACGTGGGRLATVASAEEVAAIAIAELIGKVVDGVSYGVKRLRVEAIKKKASKEAPKKPAAAGMKRKDKEYMDGLLAQVCDDFEFFPDQVSGKKAMQCVKLKGGKFVCYPCNNFWTSHLSWMVINCKKREIQHRFKQKCTKCRKPRGFIGASKEEHLLRAFRVGVLRCLERTDGLWGFSGPPSQGREDEEHKAELCEKCKYGKTRCFNSKWEERTEESIKTANTPVEHDALPEIFSNSWGEDKPEALDTWSDVAKALRVPLRIRMTRAKAFHLVKTELLKHIDELKIEKDCHGGVYEAGSFKKATQLPFSDIDIVVFVKDFHEGIYTERLKEMVTILKTHFGEDMFVAGEQKYSRSFELKCGFAKSDTPPRDDGIIKFDLLLGGNLGEGNNYYKRLLTMDDESLDAWGASVSPRQVDFVRSRAQSKNPENQENSIALRDAILALKKWRIIRREQPERENDYLPPYALELIAVEVFDNSRNKSTGWLFWKSIQRIKEFQDMNINFVGKSFCEYPKSDISPSIYSSTATAANLPIIVDPANPMSDVLVKMKQSARHPYPTTWSEWKAFAIDTTS